VRRYIERSGAVYAVDQLTGRASAQDVLHLPLFGADWEQPAYPRPLKERGHRNITGSPESVSMMSHQYQERCFPSKGISGKRHQHQRREK